MLEDYAINKAALGIRYLLKYLENGRMENFNIVLDCLDEIELWCLITFYSNNIDELYDSVPDHILKGIFEMIPINESDNIEKLFGRGFKTSSKISYKDQFKIIRDTLCHKHFSFNKGLIYIKYKDYEAVFDLLWLEKLVGTTLKSQHLDLKKGMSDIAVSTSIDPIKITNENIQEICKKGLVQLYKIISLTSNKEAIVDTIKGLDINPSEMSFYYLMEIAKGIAASQELNVYDSPEKNIEAIKKQCKEIEKFLGNKIKIELLPLEISDELMHNEEFKNLNIFDKLGYMAFKSKCDDSRESYNYQTISNIVNLFEQLRQGKQDRLSLFAIKDASNFLLKVYANIYFGMLSSVTSFEIASKYGIDCHFAYGAKIYKEYLKILKKSYEELKEYKAPRRIIDKVIKDMETYSRLLEDAMNGEASKEFNWHMRNSIIHDQVEFKEEMVRFYTTGRKIKVFKYSKKNKEWNIKEYNNNKPIWEMITSRTDLLRMLDEMYKEYGIEIQVNISKYVKRKSYLK